MKSAIFLDRDGVINEVLTNRVKFVNQPKDFHLLPGAGYAIQLLNEAGYPVFVVTNQGGVGLGYMSEANLLAIHQKMEADLAKEHAYITEVAYCPHKPNDGCACRKPKAEMLFNLAKKYQIDLSHSYMVGDRFVDIKAGLAAGTIPVQIGNTEKTSAIHRFPDLLSFSKWVTDFSIGSS